MFEIDKFESIKEQLIDKIDEEQIEIFRTYLQAKKEVIQEFHSLFFNFPTLLEKASDNLVNKFFYDFVINLPVEDSRFGKVHLTMPPKRNHSYFNEKTDACQYERNGQKTPECQKLEKW